MKLCDMGISKLAPTDDFVIDAVDRVSGRGPLLWIAPEGLRAVCRSTDVYMFGSFMFEVLTAGKLPYFWMDQVGVIS